MIPYDKATEIALAFAKEITAMFPDKIMAVFAIGSLGSDYYRPGQSDIDTAVITNADRIECQKLREEIEFVADRYWKRFDIPKGFGAIVFAPEQLYPPYRKEEELILEILRLKTQSKLLLGQYDMSRVPIPDKRAIIEDAIAFQEWADGEKAKDPCFRIRDGQTLVNSTLIALKRYLMIRYDVVEFNKFKVVGLYMGHEPPFVDKRLFDFVEASLRGDAVTPDDDHFRAMLASHDELYSVVNKLVFA